jgi:hypothetical protein
MPSSASAVLHRDPQQMMKRHSSVRRIHDVASLSNRSKSVARKWKRASQMQSAIRLVAWSYRRPMIRGGRDQTRSGHPAPCVELVANASPDGVAAVRFGHETDAGHQRVRRSSCIHRVRPSVSSSRVYEKTGYSSPLVINSLRENSNSDPSMKLP